MGLNSSSPPPPSDKTGTDSSLAKPQPIAEDVIIDRWVVCKKCGELTLGDVTECGSCGSNEVEYKILITRQMRLF